MAILLLAPGFPAKMRRSRRTRLKLIPLLLALISVFELELCKTHQHEQLSCECALVSCLYIYGHVNTSVSPTLTGVAFVANRTPQPFSTDKHPWGHPDLPEQPQTWLLLPWAGRPRVGGRVMCFATTQQCLNRESRWTAR